MLASTHIVQIKHMNSAHPLENLLASDVLQSGIQVLDLGDQIRHLVLVAALDLARLANRQVEFELDVTGRHAVAQPTLRRGCIGGREANLVLAAVCRAEGEAAVDRGALLRYDAVVVVECFFDRDVDAHFVVGLELRGAVIVLEGIVVACELSISDVLCWFV